MSDPIDYAALMQRDEMPADSDYSAMFRQIQNLRRNHPYGDMAAGMLPGVGQATGVMDMTDPESSKLERAGGGLGLLPFGRLIGKLREIPGVSKMIAGKRGMEALGVPVTKDTPVGLHGGPIHEIPDFDATIDKDLVKLLSDDPTKSAALIDLMDHPEAFRAYPHLKNVEVGFDDMDAGGVFQELGGGRARITIKRGMSPDQTRSVVLHEGQHGVAALEGYDDVFRGSHSKDLPEYYNNPGEVEARTVQERRDFHPRDLPNIPLQAHLEDNANRALQEKYGLRGMLDVLKDVGSLRRYGVRK